MQNPNKQDLIDKLLLADNFSNNLDEVKQVINNLKLEPNYPIILVGGTNGKGSTCAYLNTILTLSGYKTGCFTSPHVIDYNERITLSNQVVDDNTLIHGLDHVISHSKTNLGIFKTFTLAAHYIFMQRKIDIAIIEVGVGGKYDVTNLFEPEISVITSIDFDHQAILGNTLDEIANQKAGILRADKPFFYGSKDMPITLYNYAKNIKANLYQLGINFTTKIHESGFDFIDNIRNLYSIPFPAMRGIEQINNVALSIAILNKIHDRFPTTITTIKNGILQTRLTGRFQVLPGIPQIILDVAHNAQAVSQMLKNMLKLPFVKNSYAIFGIASDKDISQIIQLSKSAFDRWFIAPIKSNRALNLNRIEEQLTKHGVIQENIIKCETITQAFEKTQKSCTTQDRIVCFGSFLVVEEIYKINLNSRY